uniref:Uncharacterized protein n=1 Tax=Rhizophora mucronata TaxID=61149 RepID=A0A2P2N9U0_RHIMU
MVLVLGSWIWKEELELEPPFCWQLNYHHV